MTSRVVVFQDRQRSMNRNKILWTHTIDHVFTICIRNENQNQTSFHPFGPHDIFVLIELTLGHLRHHLTDVPPQSNSPPDNVLRTDHSGSSKLPLALRLLSHFTRRVQTNHCKMQKQYSKLSMTGCLTLDSDMTSKHHVHALNVCQNGKTRGRQ